MIKVITKTENETLRLAEKIGSRLFPGAVILLNGGLGAGKTIFVKGLARGLNIQSLVKSPTYTIIDVYEGGALPLVHFDLYRLSEPDEFYAIGADEYIGAYNVCAIEWPSNIGDVFGTDYIDITIRDIGDDVREIAFSPVGKKHKAWFESIKNDIDS
jgi:tRNA threonylcarbamoyladenosine biosynthesis protein TsaE